MKKFTFCALDGISAPSVSAAEKALSALVAAARDREYLLEECGDSFLRDLADDGFHFETIDGSFEMWEGEDGLLRDMRDLVIEYAEALKDDEIAASLENDEINSFDDFMDSLTAMGGFLHPLYDYFGITIDGTDTAERFEYIEEAFDEAERWLIHHPGEGKRVTIVRYIPA